MAILMLPFAAVAGEVSEEWEIEATDSIIAIVRQTAASFRANLVALPVDPGVDLDEGLSILPEPLLLERSESAALERRVFAYATPEGAVTVDQRLVRAGSGAALLTGTVSTARFRSDWPELQGLLDSFQPTS